MPTTRAPRETKQRRAVGRMLIRALTIPTAFLFASTCILLWEDRYLIHSLQWVDQSDEVKSQTAELQRLFIDMETGLRAYTATGNEELLQPYKDSERQVQGRFDQVSQLVADNAEQREGIDRLRRAFVQWTQYAQEMLRDRETKGSLNQFEFGKRLLLGKRLMDEIRKQISGISASEDRLREIRFKRALMTEQTVFATTALLALTGCAILAIRTRRQIQGIIENEALRGTNELLETFVRNAPAGLVMFDRNMRYIRASENWLRDVGLAGRDIVGESHYELFPNLPAHIKEAHRRGLAGESVSGETEWMDAAGKGRTAHWAIQPYGNTQAQGGGIIIFAEDITQRRRSEDALRESEARFRTLVQHASDAFFLHDEEGRLIDVNQQACDSLGYTREELLRMTVLDIEEDFDLQKARDAWRDMKFSGPVTLEGHHRRKDGSRFPHEARLSTYQLGDRQFILGLVRDTTERKQIEAKMHESEATTRTLLDTASQAILAVEASGAIVLANRMVGHMFGYEPHQLIGKELETLMPGMFRDRHKAHRERFNRNPTPRVMGIGMELMGLRSDGTEFPIEVSLSSVDTNQGFLAVSFVSDITARKLAEGALRDSEQKLRMLAGSLLTAQEDERRSLARELHDDITQQLAFLSIELGKLAGELPDSQGSARTTVQELQKQALRASIGVRRLSHGLHPSVITDFGLSVALEEFCEDFERVHDVAVEFEETADDSSLTDTEATCLYRIAQESMRNAVVHGHATEIKVDLSVDGGSIRLRVADNGVGFDARQDHGKASLGIISMTERVRLARGTLALASIPGQGTEIIATVPITGERNGSNTNTAG